MKVLIAGGSGFVGSHLAEHLKAEGYHITLLTRKNSITEQENYDRVITWVDLATITPDLFDVVINLCGYGISDKRWSREVRRQLFESRLDSTEKLIEFIGDSQTKLINASAVGFYPFSKQQQTEQKVLDIEPNKASLSRKLVENWERLVKIACLKDYHIIRFGVVLGSDGGMVEKLYPSVKWGVGAVIGDGSQLISWVHVDDLTHIIKQTITGQIDAKVINAVAPEPVSQKDFINYFAKTLNRPRFLWIPKTMVKLMFGQMGKELLLSSQNVYSQVLEKSEYEFQYPDYQQALNQISSKLKNKS